MISRICREFGGYPDEALRAYQRAPDLIERVMELRDYERAFDAVRAANSENDLPPEGSNRLVDLAYELLATGGRGKGQQEPA